MKVKKEKPAFLKTFPEYTIEELRALPISRLFTLFLQEVGYTFSERELPEKVKKNRTVKKKVEKHILVAKIKKTSPFPHVNPPHLKINTSGLTAAMKRVFTPGTVPEYSTKKKELHGKKEKEETVVFSKTSIH